LHTSSPRRTLDAHGKDHAVLRTLKRG